jgi:hypothetical protein
MVAYLVNQIVLGNLTYKEVITRRPDLQSKIDAYILDKGISIDKME